MAAPRKPVRVKAETSEIEQAFGWPMPTMDLRFRIIRYARILQQRFTHADGTSVWVDVPAVHDEEAPPADS